MSTFPLAADHDRVLIILFCSTQKILHHARMAQQGLIKRDPVKESIGLELDMINILSVPPASSHLQRFNPSDRVS